MRFSFPRRPLFFKLFSKHFSATTTSEADRIFAVLQNNPTFSSLSAALSSTTPTNPLILSVLRRVLLSLTPTNRPLTARLAHRFFLWSTSRPPFVPSSSASNLVLHILARCQELKPMWRLFETLVASNRPVTARTLNILISSAGEAGLRRNIVVRFLKSKGLTFRPFKCSFDAILHSLVCSRQYRLCEWVHRQMVMEGHSANVFACNVLLCAKYRLGKLDEFHDLLDEMGRKGINPDLHTYNLLLHVLGKGDKPLAALNLLGYMEEVGCDPTVLHYTTLIDGLGRAGNLEACAYFFEEMGRKELRPDVVCYTVMITGYVVASELEKALGLFDRMLEDGQLPNVFTYNSVIRGLCVAGEFDKACSMLSEMEKKGCIPNFSVYSTMVQRLRNAGKVSEAQSIINDMVEKGRYVHLLHRFRGYRRL